MVAEASAEQVYFDLFDQYVIATNRNFLRTDLVGLTFADSYPPRLRDFFRQMQAIDDPSRRINGTIGMMLNYIQAINKAAITRDRAEAGYELTSELINSCFGRTAKESTVVEYFIMILKDEHEKYTTINTNDAMEVSFSILQGIVNILPALGVAAPGQRLALRIMRFLGCLALINLYYAPKELHYRIWGMAPRLDGTFLKHEIMQMPSEFIMRVGCQAIALGNYHLLCHADAGGSSGENVSL